MTPRTDDYATVFVATCDLAGQVRGRAVPPSEHDAVLRSGTGWVPANLAISSFGPIAPDNVFGSRGDLRLVPDAGTAVGIPADGARPGDAALPRRPDAAGRTALGMLPAHLPARRPRGAARTHRPGGRRRLRARIRARRPAGERSVLAPALPGGRTLRIRSGTAAGARRPRTGDMASRIRRRPVRGHPPPRRCRGRGRPRRSPQGTRPRPRPAAVACPSPSPRSSTPTAWATAFTSI